MKLKSLLVSTVALLCAVGSWAQETPTNGSAYYIYNEANDLFFTRGADWGTQAFASPVGIPWRVEISDGKYTLKMYDIYTQNDADRGLGFNGSYTDNGSPIALTPSGNASDGFTLENGGNYITCPTSKGAVSMTSTASTWKFLTQAQYDVVLASRASAQEAAVASSKGIVIPGGNTLNDVVSDASAWTATTTADALPTKATWPKTGGTQRSNNYNEGTYGVELFQSNDAYISKTISSLTPGIYKVSVRGMRRDGTNGCCADMKAAGFYPRDVYMEANGNIIPVKAWADDNTANDNPDSPAQTVTIINNGGYTSEGFVYVGDDGNLNLKIYTDAFWWGCWFVFNGVSYTYYNNEVSDEDAAALLESVPTGKMSDATKDALDDAVSALESSHTISNYNTLTAAIAAANISVAEYATIASGIVPTNDVTGWAKSTTNGALACNTWSTEANTDGSGMTTPFIQDWVGSGTPLAGGASGGKLYYSFTDLTPGEKYAVTARVRVFNESGSGVTGATFFCGADTKSIDTYATACAQSYATKGKSIIISCVGEVDGEGHLQFGVELDDDSPINWIAIKDVTIAEATDDVPTAISVGETARSLHTNTFIKMLATITPSTADDKTVQWASSDPTVATISTDGTILAHKAGSATITATAIGGTDIEVSATITVTDATAPAYYSAPAAGDFYIMNAATGLFLGGANDWGTHASLIEHGIPFTVAVGEGVYTLDSHTYNNATDHFLSGTYVDGGSTNLYITAISDGKYSISTADGSAFLTGSSFSTMVNNNAENADSEYAQWYFISKNDRDKMLASTPSDATYYVKQANISRNLSAGAQNANAWSQYDVGGEQKNSNYVAQVYNKAVDNYQTIANIPNGTYKVSVQAFSNGADVKFYANDQKVDVLAKPTGISKCTQASDLFLAKAYPNEVTVTVTDRTLKIGFEGNCSGAKWLCYDNVEVCMTSYTANTGIDIEDNDLEVEVGEVVNIVAATNPSTASFNRITYTSDDEDVATVDENGVVTGVAVGSATITVTANELENYSETVTITVNYTPATSEDYADLTAAITAAEGKTLGFDKDEYAPYNNTVAIAALAAAKAIDQDASNTQISVQRATSTLTSAVWTANAADVDAIYNGDFSSGSWRNDTWYPDGWKIVSGWSATVDDAKSSSGKGIYRQPGDTHYGDQGVYTMPLAGNQAYKLTFKYGYRDQNATPTISVLNASSEGLPSTVCATAYSGDNYKTAIITQTMYFRTGAAGNYVLNMNTDKNIVFSDVSLVKATQEEVTLSSGLPANNTFYQTLTLDRAFSADKWNTLCVPFAFDKTEFAEVKVLDDITVTGDHVSMSFADADDEIAAGTPCLVKPASDKANWELSNVTISASAAAGNTAMTEDDITVTYQGVFTSTGLDDGDNAWIVKDNLLYNVVNAGTVGAYRAYFTVETATPVKALSFSFDDLPTAIEGVEAAQNENAEIYNIAGQRLNKAQKGVNIVNGKKVLVK